jgi:hypothetical protein
VRKVIKGKRESEWELIKENYLMNYVTRVLYPHLTRRPLNFLAFIILEVIKIRRKDKLKVSLMEVKEVDRKFNILFLAEFLGVALKIVLNILTAKFLKSFAIK